MAAIALLGSLCSGHDGFPPRNSVTGQGLHTVNGVPVHCVGDSWADHVKPDSKPHGGVTVTGESRHTINGSPVARVGDLVSCGSTIVTGNASHEVS